MHLTIAIDQAYPSPASKKNEAGFDILGKAAIGRKVLSNAAFLLPQCARKFMGGLGREPQGSPVRFPGMSTCSVPLTRLTSGSGSFNEQKASTS